MDNRYRKSYTSRIVAVIVIAGYPVRPRDANLTQLKVPKRIALPLDLGMDLRIPSDLDSHDSLPQTLGSKFTYAHALRMVQRNLRGEVLRPQEGENMKRLLLISAMPVVAAAAVVLRQSSAQVGYIPKAQLCASLSNNGLCSIVQPISDPTRH